MTFKIFRAVILGAPASGKGTISERIVKKFGFTHVSAGDLLRVNIANSTDLGRAAKGYIEKGHLVPDELVIKCILNRIKEIGNTSWLLDGFPRTTFQAKYIQENEPVDAVINLKVPFEVIVDRVRCRWVHLPSGRVYNIGFNAPKVPFKDDVTGEDLVQRSDDNPVTVKKRLELYESCTKPVIEYFRNLDLVYDFEGETTNEIWPKIDKYILEKTKDIIVTRQ